MNSARVGNFTIAYQDQLEFDTLVEEIFKKRTYYVDIDSNTPVIVDAGAHIGMTTLYLASLYPRAHFICIEPDPRNATLLRKNLEENMIQSYEVHEVALGGKQTPHIAQFHSGTAFGVFSSLKKGGWTGEEGTQTVQVETKLLSDVMPPHVDFLKMDIEGMETEVIQSSQENLRTIDHLIIEFHRTEHHSEDKLLKILQGHYPSVTVQEDKRKERNYKNRLLLIEVSR